MAATFGPLGFLNFPQPVGHNLLIAIFFHVMTHAILAAAMANFILLSNKNARLSKFVLLAISAVVLLNLLYWLQGTGLQYILLISILLLNHNETRKNTFLFTAALYVSMVFLIKPGLAIICSLIWASYLFKRLLINKERRLFLHSVLFMVASFFLIWLLLYRGIGSIPGYIFCSWEFMKGSSSAVTTEAQNNWILIALSFLMMCFAVFWVNEKKLYLVSGMLFFPFIVLFKYAYGRQDYAHVAQTVYFLLIYYFLIAVYGSLRKKIVSFSLFMLISFSLYCANLYQANSYNLFFDVVSSLRNNHIRNISQVLGYKAYRKELELESNRNLDQEKLSPQILERIKSSPVDVFPWNATLIAANGLNWRPRPILQAYAAYTPWLDAFDANFFVSEGAPPFVLWVKDRHGQGATFDGIDGRYLLNDEPKTTFNILNFYEPVSSDEKAVLLKRKEMPTFKGPDPLYSEMRGWGEWINVPVGSNGMIKAKIRFERNWYGVMKRVLWKENTVTIEYKLEDGSIITHRLAPDNAVSGVWAGHYLTALASPSFLNGETITQMRFSHKDKNIFKPNFPIFWEEYKLNS